MSKITIANTCMIIDKKSNRVLVIDRKKDWKGIAFPGGHLEDGESVTQSVKREVLEETGLTITNLVFKGIKHWYNTQTTERYMVFCFKTEDFTGALKSNHNEGEVFWLNIGDLQKVELADGLREELPMYFDKDYFEGFAEWDEKSVGALKWE